MSNKTKEFKIVYEYDDDLGSDYLMNQDLYEVNEDGDHEIYYVYNLTDCPEDAIIDRSLFSAEEYVAAVEYGMSLGRQGYTSTKVTYVERKDK